MTSLAILIFHGYIWLIKNGVIRYIIEKIGITPKILIVSKIIFLIKKLEEMDHEKNDYKDF